MNIITSQSENEETLNKLISLDSRSRKQQAKKSKNASKSIIRSDESAPTSVTFNDSQTSFHSPDFIHGSVSSSNRFMDDDDSYCNRKSYPLLCDLEDDFDLPVFNNMVEARKTFEGFIESNLRHCRSDKMCKLMMKFIKVLADFPKKELKWLQLYYTLLTLPKDTSETMRVQLQQQLATTREWKIRSNYDSHLDPKNKHRNYNSNSHSGSNSNSTAPNFPSRGSQNPAAFPTKHRE